MEFVSILSQSMYERELNGQGSLSNSWTEMNRRIAFQRINLLVTSVWGIWHRARREQEFALWPFKLGRRGNAWLAAHRHSPT
jgi:hypothetical protein